MSIKKVNFSRILAICGFIALTVGTVLNIIYGGNFKDSILPNIEYLTIFINGISALLCFILIFIPNNLVLLLIILIIQSIYDVLTGFEILGLFLFMFINLILFAKGFFKTHFLLKIGIILSCWILVLVSLFAFGGDRFVFAFVVMIFMISAFCYIYNLLRENLCNLLPATIVRRQMNLNLPSPGENLNLAFFNFTERQKKCIQLIVYENLSYKDIADQLCISLSSIKHDVAEILKVFGVKNREELMLLLCQYKIEM